MKHRAGRSAYALLIPAIAGFGTLFVSSTDGIAQAARACPHQEGERDRITRTLQSAVTCQRAYDTMNACRSNTSGDVELAEIVISRCEGEFLSTLTPAARKSYDQEREACRRRYAKREGTMYVSFSVTCEAGVAARLAGAAERRSRSR